VHDAPELGGGYRPKQRDDERDGKLPGEQYAVCEKHRVDDRFGGRDESEHLVEEIGPAECGLVARMWGTKMSI
jgi:hypothetical protein